MDKTFEANPHMPKKQPGAQEAKCEEEHHQEPGELIELLPTPTGSMYQYEL